MFFSHAKKPERNVRKFLRAKSGSMFLLNASLYFTILEIGKKIELFQAEFDASELITQRELVSQRINQFLGQRCATFGLILDDISIVSIS